MSTFNIGDRVEKINGSAWLGKVVGQYSTSLTPEGYAVESEREPGSVQIYPAKALRLATYRATAPACPRGCGQMGAYFGGWRCASCGIGGATAPAAGEQTEAQKDAAFLERMRANSESWQAYCAKSAAPAAQAEPLQAEQMAQVSANMCLPNGLMFDAFGEPRTRYVRVSLDGSHCIMHPSEGDTYLADAKANGDESAYEVADVYLSELEFEDLGEFDGF